MTSGNNAEPLSGAEPRSVDELGKEASLEKLRLETQLLRQQLSPQSRFLEWLKAFTAPIAILAFVWTIATGFDQIRQAHVARDREAFDRAVSRLGSDKAGERLTGIVSLEVFLTQNTPSRLWADLFSARDIKDERRSAIVRHLMDATALEPDMAVRGALLDTVSRLKADRVGQGLLDESLRTVAERNRTMLLGWKGRFQNASEFYDDLNLTPQAQLSYDELGRIHATSTAIVLLLGQGAKTANLDDIYCVACDFSRTEADLSGVHFERSLLKGANFKGMTLRGAFFDSADLLMSNFTSADLTRAHFSDRWHKNYLPKAFLRYDLTQIEPPDFSCADLNEATFDENALIGMSYSVVWDERGEEQPRNWITLPEFGNANLSGTDFSKLSAYAIAQLKVADPILWPSVLPFKYNGNILVVAQKGTKKAFTIPVASDLKWSDASMRRITNRLLQARNWQAAKLPKGWTDYIPQDVTQQPLESVNCNPRNVAPKK